MHHSSDLLYYRIALYELNTEVLHIFQARMKDNVLGVLTWWRTPRRVSSSPGLSDKPSRAHLTALELTSRDASWITTTLWAAVDMMGLFEAFATGIYVRLKRKMKPRQDNGLGLFWLKQCSLGRFLQSLNWSDTWWCTLKAEKNPGCISAIGRLWGLLMATFVAIFSWNHYPDDWAELSQRYVQEANIWAVTSWRKNRWVGGLAFHDGPCWGIFLL